MAAILCEGMVKYMHRLQLDMLHVKQTHIMFSSLSTVNTSCIIG